MISRLKGRNASRDSISGSGLPWALLLAGLLGLSGCASNQPAPEVLEAGQTVQAPSQQNIEMIRALSQINDLKEELKLLRNAVEEMQFQQNNAQRRQQDLFQDVDRRLLALEDAEKTRQGQVLTTPPLTPSGQVLAEGQTRSRQTGSLQTGSQQDETAIDQAQPSDSVATTDETQVEQSSQQVDSVTVSSATQNRSIQNSGGNGSTSVSMTEQQAYDSAFEMLKQSRYQDSIEQFQALVNTWPQSQLADDALYWMSEANYVNREFEAALNGFRAVVERYPDSSRLPEAMLKVGYIQYDIGAYEQAAQTFQDILARFPGHQVTVAAETRLRRIQQTIQ
ncbi:MAG: tol-pal system protein YbgF [bacterium]